MKRFYLVGAGALGLALSESLRSSGFDLTGVWNRGDRRRDETTKRLGIAATGGSDFSGIENADLILIAVADDAITSVSAALADCGSVKPGAVVAHTSGCLPASELHAIPDVARGSVHPLLAVPASSTTAPKMHGVNFALEGEENALAALEKMVYQLGGKSFRVAGRDKPRYHAAAVMASNLLVTLLNEAVTQAKTAGIAAPTELLTQLAKQVVEQVARVGPKQALTGPVLRGDLETVASHLRALDDSSLELYRELSRSSVAIARERGLDEERAAEMEDLLTQGD